MCGPPQVYLTPARHVLAQVLTEALRERHDIRRDHEHRGAVVLGTDLGDHLHAPQLHRHGIVDHLLGGLAQFPRRLELRFRLDDARAFLADRLRLHGHHLLHRLRQLDVLHLEALDFDAPAGAGFGDAIAQQAVDLVALLQYLIEVVLADDVAQAGERQLVNRGTGLAHRDHRLAGIDDAIPENRVEPHGDAVARDGLLPFGGYGARADVDRHRALDAERNDPVEARSAQPRIAAESEDDTTLILLCDPQSAEEHPDDDREDDVRGHGCLFLAPTAMSE